MKNKIAGKPQFTNYIAGPYKRSSKDMAMQILGVVEYRVLV